MGTTNLTVLALDPSLRNTGYVLATITGSDVDYVSTGVITTKHTKKSIDTFLEDTMHLYTEVAQLLDKVDVVCSEASLFSQNASNALTNGIVLGLLTVIKNRKNLTVVTQSQAKKATKQAFKDKDAKQVVMEWASAHLPDELIPKHNGKVNATKFNHIADALAVLHASLPTLRKSL